MDKELNASVPALNSASASRSRCGSTSSSRGSRATWRCCCYGPDLDVLRRKSEEIERAAKIPGATGIKTPTSGRLPMLRIAVRRDQLARYGIKGADVLEAGRRPGRDDRWDRLRGAVSPPDPGPPPRGLAE